MAQCTAPVRGHTSSSAAKNCPACRYRFSNSYRNSGSTSSLPSSSPGNSNSRSSTSRSSPRWSKPGTSIMYTPNQVQSLTPIRQAVETRASERPDLRDVFLCHAWDDRLGAAKELHDLLEKAGVKVWFSEKDLGLGMPMMRAIDKGLLNSRIGLVLVTPALLVRISNEGIADKELSVLLARNQLVPIVHNTTYDALRNVSPMLASRSGLDTREDSIAVVAAKIAELVSI